MISTNYKNNIPRINIRFITNKKGKEKFSFPYVAILDSGSNIHQIPKDIADTLDLKTIEEERKITTAEGTVKEKIQITDDVIFEIWGDKISKSDRFNNEKFKIGKSYSDFLVGTPVFQYFTVIFVVSKKITILAPKQ
ncbi:MAG: hypothetical protein JSW06_08375 [Thermoplasmatales archaeon]|nr:MAG: hypothetical protein JSW06_08375 [Thermoplasmatales archaeon]